jgi:hypothetical protein
MVSQGAPQGLQPINVVPAAPSNHEVHRLMFAVTTRAPKPPKFRALTSTFPFVDAFLSDPVVTVLDVGSFNPVLRGQEGASVEHE